MQRRYILEMISLCCYCAEDCELVWDLTLSLPYNIGWNDQQTVWMVLEVPFIKCHRGYKD